MEDIGENMKNYVNANINNLKTNMDNESVSSKSSSDSSEILQSEPLANYNSVSANESKNGFVCLLNKSPDTPSFLSDSTPLIALSNCLIVSNV